MKIVKTAKYTDYIEGKNFSRIRKMSGSGKYLVHAGPVNGQYKFARTGVSKKSDAIKLAKSYLSKLK